MKITLKAPIRIGETQAVLRTKSSKVFKLQVGETTDDIDDEDAADLISRFPKSLVVASDKEEETKKVTKKATKKATSPQNKSATSPADK